MAKRNYKKLNKKIKKYKQMYKQIVSNLDIVQNQLIMN